MNKKFNKASVSVVVGSLFLPFMANVALAQTVTTTEEMQKVVTLPVSFNKEVNRFGVTHLTGTKKLVLDFYDVKDSLVRETVSNNPLITNINGKVFGNRLRVIVDVAEPVHYLLVKQGNDVVLKLEKAPAFKEVKMIKEPLVTAVRTEVIKTEIVTETKVETVTAPVFNSVKDLKLEEPQVMQPTSNVSLVQNKFTEIEHVSMKKENNNTKVTFTLNNNVFNPVFKRENNILILDIKGVNIPLEFQKNVDTQSLGNMLKSVDIGTQAGNARVVFQANNGWDYSAYQLNNKFVVEFKPQAEKEDKAVFKGKPLSLNFQNMDVRGILQVIADFTNLNIMASDSVQGNLSLRLKDVPWDQALNLVLESKNLTQVKEGNVIWVATSQEISEKNKSRLEIKNQLSELEPLQLKFFQLNHYNAKEMKAVLEGSSSSSNPSDKKEGSKIFLSDKGMIGLDGRNNSLFVQDTEDKVKAIEVIIKKLDVPVRQVLVEAKLIIAKDGFQKQLGSKFGFALGKSSGNNRYSTGSNQSQSQQQSGMLPNSQSSDGNNLSGTRDNKNVTLFDNVWSSGVTGGGSLGFTILNAITGNALSLEISALENKNLAQVISSPKLLTTDNKKAEIKQGTQVPYTIPGTSTTPAAVNFKEAYLKLGVTPQVSPNGRIVMDLEISKDDVGQRVSLPGGGSVPSIDTRQINTQVTVNDGQTVILGGIYEINSAKDLAKVPFLGDIPILGNLFKNTNNFDEKVELVIMITPHVINDSDLDSIDQGRDVTEIELKK